MELPPRVMDLPPHKYFQGVPNAILVRITEMSPLVHSGWHGIWLRMWMQRPPGLLRPLDLDLLERWSNLTPKAWAANRLTIMGQFLYHPATHSLHAAEQQQDYWTYCISHLPKGIGGAKGGRTRRAKRDKKVEPEMTFLLPDNPYEPYSRNLHPINAETWEEIVKKDQQIRANRTIFEVSSATTNNNEVISHAPPAAGLEAGAAGEGLMAFIARLDDPSLEKLKQQTLAALAPQHFMRQFCADKSPRESATLARLMQDFASQHGTAAAPPASADATG